jgi:hypothetical protein
VGHSTLAGAIAQGSRARATSRSSLHAGCLRAVAVDGAGTGARPYDCGTILFLGDAPRRPYIEESAFADWWTVSWGDGGFVAAWGAEGPYDC